MDVRRRILVVEDDGAIRALMTRLIVRQNWTADEATDGVQALALMRATAYDVILLDLMLPELPGDALLDELRRSMPATLNRVIVVTASPGHARKIDTTGLCAVLTKPFDINELTSVLRACAEGRHDIAH